MPITAPLRVASVPSDHPYVRHLAPVGGDDAVLRLPDPPVPGAPAGQWWPSPVLEPAWLREHAGELDVVHVHFGFEHRTAAQLRELVAVLRELRLPLVLTLHDLQNPHLSDQSAHDAALDVLVPAAAACLTLTPGAAAETARRWGVTPTVVPHPHVVPLERMGAVRRRGRVVGLHAKPRAGNDPAAVRDELAGAVAATGGRLAPELDRRLTDDELWDHLAALDVLVLAYRRSTHSGFVEACHDLGTTVVAPRVGYLAEQHAVVPYDLDVPGALTDALLQAYENPPAAADPAQRTAQRAALATVHRELYRAVAA